MSLDNSAPNCAKLIIEHPDCMLRILFIIKEKEVVYILGNKYRYEVTETQIKRSLNEIMVFNCNQLFLIFFKFTIDSQ